MIHLLADLLLIVACLTAAASLAAAAGRISATLDVAAHFTPIWLASGVACVLLGLALGPAGGPGAALGGVAAVVCASLMAPDLMALVRQPTGLTPSGRSIKVIQLNLWCWNRDPQATIDWLIAEAADVIVVEEALADAASIPEALWAAYPHQSDAHAGTRILAAAPMVDDGVFRARSAQTQIGGAWANLDHPAGKFAVVGFHATWPIPPGLQQGDSADLARRLDAFDRGSLIVCGDFNSTPWSGALRRQDRLFGLERRSRALFTWPVQPYSRLRLVSPVPFLALDHIYAGEAWETVSVRRGPRLGSDHLPVVAVLTRRPEPPGGRDRGEAGRGGRTGPLPRHEDSPTG